MLKCYRFKTDKEEAKQQSTMKTRKKGEDRCRAYTYLQKPNAASHQIVVESNLGVYQGQA
jgi:hypothetical protein